MTHLETLEPRQYPRLQAPVYFTRAGPRWPLLRRERKPAAAPLGGVRVYSDEAPEEGVPLQLEIFLPDGTSVICKVEVAWVDTLPEGAARYDVGLRFTAIYPHDRERLSRVLEARQL